MVYSVMKDCELALANAAPHGKFHAVRFQQPEAVSRFRRGETGKAALLRKSVSKIAIGQT
jgi:hypothetical protein